MANEVLVANLQPLQARRGRPRLFLRAADERQGPARAVAQVLRGRTRPRVFDNPLSSRFDENDALLYFDDVKVPWERVFVHRDTDMCRAQFHDTPGHAYQNYQAQIRLSVKIRFLVGVARTAGRDDRHHRHAAGARDARQAGRAGGMVEAMLRGMEAAGTQHGEYFVPNKHFMYAAQVLTQELYPRVSNASASSPAAR